MATIFFMAAALIYLVLIVAIVWLAYRPTNRSLTIHDEIDTVVRTTAKRMEWVGRYG